MNSFEKFWNAYQKKVGIDRCRTKWYRLPAQDHILIMNHVHGFVAKQRNKQYRPNPLSYLNGKMWLNEDITQEQKLVYKFPPPKPVSDYDPDKFERSEFIRTFREKIKAFYESGIPISDWGGVYTSLLKEKCGMKLPTDIRICIELDVETEATRPRNRFEPQYTGNIKSDVRDAELKWWLNRAKGEGKRIDELI